MVCLEAKNVSIRYITGDFKEIGLKEYAMRRLKGDYHVQEFWADRNISFRLEEGEMLGIIGTNGAGKSTLLKTISGIMEPSEGVIRREGSVAALLELGSGFDGDLTVRENTYLRGAMMGYTRKFMDETYDQIIEFAELQAFQDRPFKQLSSGMKSRLAFSIASLVRPDILILDEVLAVGDGAFRKKSEAKMREIIKGGATTILVSHSLGQIREMCSKVLWLHKGRQIAFGDNVREICDQYQRFLNGGQREADLPRPLEAPVQAQKSFSSVIIKRSGIYGPFYAGSEIADDRYGGKMMKEKGGLKKDILCAATLAVALYISLYFFLGYAKSGLDTPYSYSGDGISHLAGLKLVKEEGWFWFNENAGAPIGAVNLDFPASCFTSIERLIAKLIGIFTDNVVVISNIQYLLTFSLCSLTAFFVLRYLDAGRLFSLYGAALFGLAPYIFGRNIAHYSLSACYFVPFSVILCIWAFQEENEFLLINRDFFKKRKNWITVLFAFLIANNGIGYYAFFTCFFLCVVGFYKLCITKKVSSIKKPVIMIGMILFFFLLALLPVFIYQMQNGSNLGITQRSVANGEIYSLKIAQLFVPINGHNIDSLNKFISTYNTKMPLVNENRTAYLGVGGIIGFLISIVWLFIPESIQDSTKQKQLRLFSKLNLCAVLFATVGGFSSLFFLAVNFLRGYNRISIYILFISICVLILSIQQAWKVWAINARLRGVFLAILVGICIFDQMPTYGGNDARLTANKAEYQSDDNFVKSIEAQLETGDMVYQLPYHKYPEAGPVLNMSDYQLFVGYLHAPTLKWSYGGTKGREADQWNESVAALPFYNWLDAITEAGFRGIYIDARAYTPEDLAQLQGNIETATKAEPMISENGNLIFYNLYPYIAANPVPVAKKYQLGTVVAFDGSLNDAHRYFSEGMSGTEVDFAWTDGNHVKLQLNILDNTQGDLLLTLDVPRVFNDEQRMIVTYRDTTLFNENIETGTNSINIPVPAECVSEGFLELDFQLPDAVSPKALGGSEDSRNLAFGISSFSLQYEDPALRAAEYSLGRKISFDGTDNDAHRYFVEGMSRTETDFAWTDGNHVKLQLNIEETTQGDLLMTLDAPRVFNDEQRMIVTCRDTTLFDEDIEARTDSIRIPVPVECLKAGFLDLDFRFPDAVSPKELGVSEDPRKLAFGFTSFSIDEEAGENENEDEEDW